MKPIFQILSNDNDITEALRKYLISATITDDIKSGSDTLDIKLANYVELPIAGTVIKISAGFDKLHLMGAYVSDINEADLVSNFLTIKCKAVQPSRAFKTVKKTRTWDSVKLGDIVAAIGEENSLKVRFDFPDILVENEIQHNETDLFFLYRLAREYGAYFSVKNETIIFVDAITDVFYIDKSEISSGTIKTSGIEYNSVRCWYFDRKAGLQKSVVVGSGSPEYRGKTGYSSRGRAMGGARRTLKKVQKLSRGSLNLPKGRPDIYAGAILEFSGSREYFNKQYYISQVRHIITPGGISSTVTI